MLHACFDHSIQSRQWTLLKSQNLRYAAFCHGRHPEMKVATCEPRADQAVVRLMAPLLTTKQFFSKLNQWLLFSRVRQEVGSCCREVAMTSILLFAQLSTLPGYQVASCELPRLLLLQLTASIQHLQLQFTCNKHLLYHGRNKHLSLTVIQDTSIRLFWSNRFSVTT